MIPRVLLASLLGAALITALPGPGGLEAQPTSETPLEAAWVAGDCARCHEVPGMEPLSRVQSCTTCHLWIQQVSSSPQARERALELFPRWERYERNLASYLAVPDLQSAMARLDPAWVRGWLQDPHDVRPALSEGMPRFALTDPQLDALEAAFAAARTPVPATPPPDPDNLAAGAALFAARACGSCHSYGALHVGPGVPLAPDLAHARDRMSPDHLAAWIQDPRTVSPRATMPPPGVSPEEALQLRDYLLLADPDWSEPEALSDPPTATTEPVTWSQVEERVFGTICVHCHMAPELNEGRAGPGNAGGFGWAATGIELQTYEGVAAAAERIPEVLMRRRHEARRDHLAPGQRPAELERPERPGMPLGLPAIPDEDIALVLGWIEQGMPR